VSLEWSLLAIVVIITQTFVKHRLCFLYAIKQSCLNCCFCRINVPRYLFNVLYGAHCLLFAEHASSAQLQQDERAERASHGQC